MRLMVILYFVFAPLATASVFIGGHRVEFSLLLASLLALTWVIGFLTLKIGVSRDDKWSVLFWLFVASMAASLLASVYLSEAYVLGGIQIVGMVAVLLASMYISRSVVRRPAAFAFYVKVLTLTMIFIAAVGAWQFFAFNVLHTGFMADFSWINDLVGPGAKEQVWSTPGSTGPLKRANSVIKEPAFFAQTLGMVGGIALLRLGVMGKALSRPLATVIPRWGALLVLAGFVLAISINGFVLLALTVAALAAVTYRFDLRSLPRLALVGAGTIALGLLLTLGFGEAFTKRLDAIPLVLSAATGDASAPPTRADISVLSLAVNVSVALDNLQDYPLLGVGPGGHPPSYDAQVPGWVSAMPDLLGLQHLDGGALLIRLLSETGLIGTVLFLSGWLVVVLRARRAIQRALAFHREGFSRPSLALAISVGVTASCVALVIAYLFRMAIYYDPPIWVLIALTAAIPPLLKREYGERADARVPSEERGEVVTSPAEAPRPSREV